MEKRMRQYSVIPEQEIRYEELDFTNDFIFCKVLENNEQLCRELLELILERKVKRIVYLHKQKEIKITSDGKGVRLDVYLEDDENRVYNIEMQASRVSYLPQRSRYYQGMIDLNLIQKGDSYKKLKRSYVIFICMDNPFDGIRHKYTFENICREDHSIRLEDDAWRIFLTPDGTLDDISEEMKDFLQYLAGGAPKQDLTKNIHKEVESARKHEEWRLEYMTLYMRDQENIEIGIQRGIQQGRNEGQYFRLIEMVCRKLSKGSTPEEIAELFEEPLEEIQSICAVAQNHAPEYDAKKIYADLNLK